MSKKQNKRPTDRQKNFITKSQASLNWYLNNDQKIQKWIFRILLIALGLWITIATIIGTVQGIQNYKASQVNAVGVAPIVIVAIVEAVLYAILVVLWKILLRPFLMLLDSATVFFKNLGGQGVIYSIVKNQSITSIVGIFFGIAGTIFIIAIAIRGIRIATSRDVEKQEGIKRNTSLSVFGAVVGLFLMTTCFIFAVGLVSFLASWLVEVTSGGMTNIGVFVLNYSRWDGIGHATTIPAVISVGEYSGLAITLLGVAAAIFLMKFIIAAISAIFKMIVLFITSFVALAKWPQDEGGAFMGHKDDLIGVFFNFILLFLLFNLFMILISAIAPIAGQFEISNTFLMPAVIGASLFAAGAVAMTSMTKRLPELFSLKKDVGQTMKAGESVSTTYNKTGNEVKRTVTSAPNKIGRQVGISRILKARGPATKPSIENMAK